MQILLNEEPLDFVLESERHLGEVVDAMAQWLGDQGYEITGVDVDSRELPVHERESWDGLPVGDINLDCEQVAQRPSVQLSQGVSLGLRAIAYRGRKLNLGHHSLLKEKERDPAPTALPVTDCSGLPEPLSHSAFGLLVPVGWLGVLFPVTLSGRSSRDIIAYV